MLEIPRRWFKRVRAVCRQAGLTRSPPPLTIESDGDRLTLRVESADVGLAFHPASSQPPGGVQLPFEVVSAVESARDDLVRLDWSAGRGVATWTERGVPQRKTFDAGAPAPAWEPPATTVAVGRELLTAIHEASLTSDDGSHRFALGRIQLQAAGRVVGTDGRQLYRHGGFAFPWRDDRLVARTRAFGSSEFAGIETVVLGAAETHVVLTAGDWTIRLPIDATGRFPRTDEVAPNPARAAGAAVFDRAEAAFLLDVLPRLPAGSDDDRQEVALDLNGRVVVSASSADAGRTEVLLPRSSREGAEVRLTVDRGYLARTLRLGFERLHHYGPKSLVLADDGRRQFVWAVMEPGAEVDVPAERIVRLEPPPSSLGGIAATTAPTTSALVAVPASRRSTGAASPGNDVASPPLAASSAPPTAGVNREDAPATVEDEPDPIGRAERLRTTLRELLAEATALLGDLKQRRRRDRSVRATLASLKQLQSFDV
ncbi:MAG TPA: hypothetical protein VGE52_13630 [Pirellulales bacterium]